MRRQFAIKGIGTNPCQVSDAVEQEQTSILFTLDSGNFCSSEQKTGRVQSVLKVYGDDDFSLSGQRAVCTAFAAGWL